MFIAVTRIDGSTYACHISQKKLNKVRMLRKGLKGSCKNRMGYHLLTHHSDVWIQHIVYNETRAVK